MMDFYLITWKEFEKRKLLDKVELVKVDNLDEAINKLKTLNAEKRLTTTDYRAYNLSLLLANNSLAISDSIAE